MSVFFWLLLKLVASVSSSTSVNVSINWNNSIGINNVYTTYQIVAVPLTLRSSPIHDKLFYYVNNLNASFVRLEFPNTFAGIGLAQTEPPSNNYYCKHLNGNSNDNNWNLTIKCPSKLSVINNISFASFGAPTGECGNFDYGDCFSDKQDTLNIVNRLCLNKNECIIPVNNNTFNIVSNNDNCNKYKYKSFSIQLTCNISNYKYSNYDFNTHLNSVIDDFFVNVNPNNIQNKSVIDFGVFPNWNYENVSYGEGLIDNPYQVNNNYATVGNILKNQSAIDSISNYYTNIISYYYNGEFIDCYNQTIKNNLNKTYPIEILEILNDIEIEHNMTPETYTLLYDNIVLNIEKNISKDIKFMGLSLIDYTNYDYYRYFLNKSNHINSNIPIDYISFNFFAKCDTSVNCSNDNPNTYTSFFNQSDIFIDYVINNISVIKNKLSPQTKIDIDEIGIGLQTSNPPNIFWNVASGMFAYIYGKLLINNDAKDHDIAIVGQSFYVGYPDLTNKEFPASPNGIDAFGAATTMVNWTSGQPNAKYWSLKIMIDYLNIGDNLVETLQDNDAAFVQGYLHQDSYSQQTMNHYKVLFINKINENITVYLNSNTKVVDNTTANGKLYVVDQSSGENEARIESFNLNNPVVLQPFAVAVGVI